MKAAEHPAGPGETPATRRRREAELTALFIHGTTAAGEEPPGAMPRTRGVDGGRRGPAPQPPPAGTGGTRRATAPYADPPYQP